MATLTLAKRPIVGQHRGYRTAKAADMEAIEHLRYKLGGTLTPGTGKHRATR